ncbi:MAG: DUF3488 and transglutaminase-like domain-containing protein [Ornithinimicrobium sp.]
MNLDRGMWPEATVAAAASLSVGWPLTTLLQDQVWVGNAVVAVALIATLGAVLRSANALPSLVALGQLVLGALLLCWMYLTPTLWFGLPTASSTGLAVELLAEAGTVLREFAAPAPTTTGVAFLVVSVLVLTAVAVDAIGVTNASPAIAGIPLAAAFMVSVSNTGQAMQPWFFVATAGLWLIMVAQQSHRLVAHWPSAQRQEFGGPTRLGTGFARFAQGLGVLALAAAIAAAALLPHLPPTFVAAGLARNAEANNMASGTGGVDFTETMDPASDLANRSQSPVLEYTSTARLLQPLRVTSTADFDGQTWQAPDREGTTIAGTELPAPLGLSSQASVTREEVTITSNQLQPPHLAIPSETVELAISESSFELNQDSGAVLLDEPADTYTAAYLDLALQDTPPVVGPTAKEVGQDDPSLLNVPEAALPAVSESAEQIVGDATEPLEVGRALQEHFRQSSYTYSLELAPTDTDASPDAISQFLASRRGYCVQFATAMVMMARSEGIPSRMALGFLPGELQDDGSRRIVAADAHTWPELYIDGLGWTRFEPTPGVRTGPPPEVTQPQTPAGQPQQVPELVDDEPEAGPAEETGSGATGWWGSGWAWVQRWAWALAALAALPIAAAVVPLVGRHFRRREADLARSERDLVEGQWLLLTRSLSDLGVPDPGPRSPRAMHRHYAGRTQLGHSGEAALQRVTGTLEASRYGPDVDSSGFERPTARDLVDTDVMTIVEEVRAAAPWHVRTRALIVPKSGLRGLAYWLGRIR